MPPVSLRKFLPVLVLAAGCSDATEDASPSTAKLSPEDAALAAWRPAQPPNVVLILIDTLRADAVLDPQGTYDTPNIDRLGSEGLVFQRAFASAPMTLPSHTSLFSSRLPMETGVKTNQQIVPEDLPLFAEWLAEHGYESRAVVSLGTLNPYRDTSGLTRGFAAYDTHYWQIGRAEDTIARLDASLAARDASKPLFLFAHFADPHEPYDSHGTEKRSAKVTLDGELLENVVTSESPQWTGELPLEAGKRVFEFTAKGGKFKLRAFDCFVDGKPLSTESDYSETKATKSVRVTVDVPGTGTTKVQVRFWINDVPNGDAKNKRYAQEVKYTDRHVGLLIERLQALGLYQNSLVLFTSDHGEALGDRDIFYGHVERLTDEMLHVPLIVKLPEGDPRGRLLARSVDRLVPLIDVVPTVLDLLALPPLPGQRGQSLFLAHDVTHVAETHRPEAKKTQFALRDERFKMIYVVDDDPSDEVDEEAFEMYDLAADPGERSNVFEERRGERPGWESLLRTLAASSNSGDGHGDVDEERLRELEQLGYGGGGTD